MVLPGLRGVVVALGVLAGGSALAAEPLRVCADPNNWPASRQDGSGFENAIAELVAADLGRPLAYTWWAQRRGFVRKTLKAGLCDVVIGVPAHHYDMVLRTRPYYRSTYVVVSRADRHLEIERLDDPRLRTLRIGVHLIGDDGANVPPAHVLADLGIVDNVVGYPIYGDYRQDAPPRRLVDAVADGAVDVAFVWGPLAGPAAKDSPVPLAIRPLADADRYAPFSMSFDIAMGVRRDDLALRRQLQGVVDRRGAEMAAILKDRGVPLLPFVQPTMEILGQARDQGSRAPENLSLGKQASGNQALGNQAFGIPDFGSHDSGDQASGSSNGRPREMAP